MMKLEWMRTAMRRGPDKIAQVLQDTRRKLAELEPQATQAVGEEKQALEADAELSKRLGDAEYDDFVQKWIQRFDALDSE